MNTQHVLQYAGALLLMVFGLVSLFTGYVPTNQAIGFIVTGGLTFGLTKQNVALGKALNHSA